MFMRSALRKQMVFSSLKAEMLIFYFRNFFSLIASKCSISVLIIGFDVIK